MHDYQGSFKNPDHDSLFLFQGFTQLVYDTVVLSCSSVCVGNERLLYYLYNTFAVHWALIVASPPFFLLMLLYPTK